MSLGGSSDERSTLLKHPPIPFGRRVKAQVEGLDRLEVIRFQNIVKDIAWALERVARVMQVMGSQAHLRYLPRQPGR
jgi:hypothetical protein